MSVIQSISYIKESTIYDVRCLNYLKVNTNGSTQMISKVTCFRPSFIGIYEDFLFIYFFNTCELNKERGKENI